MSEKDFDKQLDEFGSSGPQDQHTAFRKLIAARKHNKASKDERFRAGMERLYLVAGNHAGEGLERLMAVATLSRVASTIRSMRKEVYGRLGELLVEPLPPPRLLEDVDDRAYIGKMCAIVLPPWSSTYAAEAAVAEETGEQVRQAFLQTLLKATQNLEAALEALIAQLQDFKPGTEDPANSMVVKLRRIFSALRGAMAETMPDPGDDPGKTLSRLIKASFADMAPPTKQEAILATSEEVAGVVHEMVRLRFSMATDAATYHALLQIKALVPVYVWEKFATKSNYLAMVATDITEALLILGRQGIIDTTLADRLTTALGNRKRSQARLVDLAQKSGLPSEVKVWLVEGRVGEPGEKDPARGESQRLSDDAQLADLLVDAQRFKVAEAVDRQHILPEIEILTPGIVPELERLLNYGLGLCDAIRSMAGSRGLRIRGNPGDEEDYAPLEHELIDGIGGARRVRVLRPMVEQVRGDGVAFVLRKGIVESVK